MHWDQAEAQKLRAQGLTQDQIGFVLGRLAENRQAADREGYKRGFETGMEAAQLRYDGDQIKERLKALHQCHPDDSDPQIKELSKSEEIRQAAKAIFEKIRPSLVPEDVIFITGTPTLCPGVPKQYQNLKAMIATVAKAESVPNGMPGKWYVKVRPFDNAHLREAIPSKMWFCVEDSKIEVIVEE